LEGTLTVNILDGGGTAAGDYVTLLSSLGGVAPAGPPAVTLGTLPVDWTSGTIDWVQQGPSLWALILSDLVAGVILQDPGDTNGDRIVDATDLTNFQAAFGLSGATLDALAFDADFDNDGDADLDDFVTLRQYFGTDFNPAPAPANPAATPEPATMSLLALGGLAILRRRRRK
jgi:hypothetical protein